MIAPTILIVDDRKVDRILYKEYFGNGYLIDELDDGDLIMDYLADQTPDLILLDWQMPRMSGLEVLKLLKGNTLFAKIPVIVITGLENEKVLEEVFFLGGIDFLNKPVRKVELLSRTNNALKLYDAQNKLLKQTKDLEALNKIISTQKEALERSLEINERLTLLKEQELNLEIDTSKKKLISYELNSSKDSQNLVEMRKIASEIFRRIASTNVEQEIKIKIKQAERKINSLTSNKNVLEDFKNLYENVDPGLFNKLTSINSKLTPLDLKHCAYIRLNLDSYEIANILNVEAKSIQMTRYRIKKKLKLPEDQSLREFVHSI